MNTKQLILTCIPLGCSQNFGTSPSIDSLPSIIEGASKTGCNAIDDTELPGAVSYFYGELEQLDGLWSGTETWLLYANPSLQATGQDDCQSVWLTTATEQAPLSCDACDMGLNISAVLDLSQTNCPEEIYQGSEQFTVSYDVQRTEGELATWFFGSSGEYLGEGYYNDVALNFLSEHQCVWF